MLLLSRGWAIYNMEKIINFLWIDYKEVNQLITVIISTLKCLENIFFVAFDVSSDLFFIIVAKVHQNIITSKRQTYFFSCKLIFTCDWLSTEVFCCVIFTLKVWRAISEYFDLGCTFGLLSILFFEFKSVALS